MEDVKETPAAGEENCSGACFATRISSWQDLSLCVWKWIPTNSIQALVFISHGIGEYMGRYEQLGQELSANGILAFGHDHVGHGKSGGDRVHVETFSTYVRDVIEHIKEAKSEHPGVPCFLMGHSMGGLIAALIASENQDLVSGFIFSSAGLEITVGRLKQTLVKIVASVFPQLGVVAVNPELISSIPEEAKAYQNDPLVYHMPLKARWSAEFIDAVAAAREQLGNITLPALIFHGTDDAIVPFSSSEFLNSRIMSSDKTFESFEANFHEVLHDVGQKRARELVRDWVIAHKD